MSDPIILVLGWHKIAEAIDDERGRQERLKREGKFRYTCADPKMGDFACLAVLVEEVGEVARLLCDFEGGKRYDLSLMRAELTQVAAVAVAWLQRLEADRE
jgi:NTP pyrophosphatase (non-canonical NTP hydrolase)